MTFGEFARGSWLLLLGALALEGAVLVVTPHPAPAAVPAPAPAAGVRLDVYQTIASCQMRRQAVIEAFSNDPASVNGMAADAEAACLDGAKHLHDLGLAQPALLQAALVHCSDELTTRGLAFVDVGMATNDGPIVWDRINAARAKFTTADQQDRACTDQLKEALDG